MRQDWAQKALWKIYRDEGLAAEEIPPEYFAILKLLRQRDAQWKRAVKRLMDNPKGITLMGRAHYYEALDDLIAAMKEVHK